MDPADPAVTVEPQELTDGPGFASLTLDGTHLGADRLLCTGRESIAGWLADRATVGICATSAGSHRARA